MSHLLSDTHIRVPLLALLLSLSLLPGFARVADAEESHVQVSNITSSSVVITWATPVPVRGHVDYGVTAGLGETAYDSRPLADVVHHVQLTGLSAATQYYFQVGSDRGVSSDQAGPARLSTFTTAQVGAGVPYTLYGTFQPNPAWTICSVVVETQGGDLSHPLVDFIGNQGVWSVNLGNLKNAATGAVLGYAPGDLIHFTARREWNTQVEETYVIGGGSPQNCGILPTINCYFVRGDVDGNGEINISDPIYSLAYQFAGGPAPPCLDAADDDDSDEVNISDPIYSLQYQFAGGPSPLPPFPGMGPDPTADGLDCNSYPPCGGYNWPGLPFVASGMEPHLVVLDAPRSEPSSRASGAFASYRGAPASDRGALASDRGALASRNMIAVPLRLITESRLLGFQLDVLFDPGRFEYAGLREMPGLDPDFMSGHAVAGLLKIGCVADFSLQEPLQPGEHHLGWILFRLLPGEGVGTEATVTVEVTNALFVTDDVTSILVPVESRIDESALDSPTACVDDVAVGVMPGGLMLRLANPYPANSAIHLESAGCGQPAEVSVYDVHGRRVRSVWSGELSAGRTELSWDGLSETGRHAGTGVYYLRTRVGVTVQNRPFVLVR